MKGFCASFLYHSSQLRPDTSTNTPLPMWQGGPYIVKREKDTRQKRAHKF